MNVQYVDHMGDDTTVVNAARVSFAKEVRFFNDKDTRLLKYLAENNHWTPFAHPQISLRIKAPVFVRTQCFKHKQGFVENEVSRRYVDDEPTFFTPDVWRGRPTNGAKQGSEGEAPPTVPEWYSASILTALQCYKAFLRDGIAPEQARMVLPQSMYTEWIWTGSLAAYARFYKQRTDDHSQKEIRDLAEMVGDIIEPLFPESWKVLNNT